MRSAPRQLFICLPERNVLLLPETGDLAEAPDIGAAHVKVLRMLFGTRTLRPGETVVIGVSVAVSYLQLA